MPALIVEKPIAKDAVSAVARAQRTQGRAEISVSLRDSQTRLKRLYQSGASKVRFPQHTPHKRMEAVLINTAGGLTGGDALQVDCQVLAGASLTLTSQACERIYRSLGEDVRYDVDLKVGPGGEVCWLPQETILFNDCRLSRRLTVDLEGDARFLAVESLIFGRRDMGEVLDRGAVKDHWRISVDGALVHEERFLMDADLPERLAHPAGLGGRCAMATIVLVGPDAETRLEACRTVLDADPNSLAGASFVTCGASGKLLIRALAQSGYDLRKLVVALIARLRPDAGPSRIWAM